MTEENPFNNGSDYDAPPAVRSGGARKAQAAQGSRLLPQDSAAEQGLLSSFLIAPMEVGAICTEKGLTHEHFHIPAHSTIYLTLLDMWGHDEPIDMITLTAKLMSLKLIDQCGGPAFVTGLFTFLPTAANVSNYIEIIREMHKLREGIRIGTTLATRCYDEQGDGPKIITEARVKLEALERSHVTVKPKTTKAIVMEVLEDLDRMHEKRGITGISTGLMDVDAMLDGLHEQELVVIGARPGSGKSSLAMNIAEHVAIVLRKPVAVFSLEMSAKQIIQRFLCGRASINTRRVQATGLTDTDYPRLTRAASVLVEAPLIIEDDSVYRSIEKLTARAHQLKRQHPDLALIVGDYFQLMRSDLRHKSDNRVNELTTVSAAWKTLAKQLELTIILLAQIKRPLHQGEPQLEDLKDCGALEQDADVVAFIEREEMRAESEEERNEAKGRATLLVKKQRNGPMGAIPLTFLAEYTRFESRASIDEEDTQPTLPMSHPPRERRREKE